MTKNDLRTLVADQKEELALVLKRERFIDRVPKEYWSPFVDSAPIKVTMGVRRAGKTVFTHQLLQGRDYGFVNFDDERLAYIGKDQLNDLLEALIEVHGDLEYLLLDEIQNVEGWELFVNRLQRRGINLCLTGSNANLLSRELSTHLTGRFVQMELLPFSFGEFLAWHEIEVQPKVTTTRERALLKRELTRYLQTGGFPEVVKAPDLKNSYLTSLYTSIIDTDIVARHRVRYVKTLRELATNLISNFSALITYNKLKNLHGLKSVHTAKNYVDLLAEAYLVQTLDKYSPKPKEVVNSPKKIYAIDTGLITTLALTTSENRGRLMENLVYLELLRKRALDPLLELYYWRDYQNHEIDFVLKRGPRHGSGPGHGTSHGPSPQTTPQVTPQVTELIQVSYVSDRNELEKRELRSLAKGSALTGCRNLTLITWDLEGEEVLDGRVTVRFVPLWRWLVGPKSS